MSAEKKNALSVTSYSNTGDIRNGVPTGRSAPARHAGQPSASPANTPGADADTGNRAGTRHNRQPASAVPASTTT